MKFAYFIAIATATFFVVLASSKPASATFCGGGIYGTSGNDIIVGTNGADAIEGLGGSDEIHGLEGVDCLDGGTNLSSHCTDVDTMYGGNGNDDFYHANGYSYGGDGADFFYFDDCAINYAEGDGKADEFFGFSFTPSITAYGNGNDDYMLGSPGDDYLDGGFGTDTIDGDNGSDTCVNGEILSNCNP
jgi:Ca2+-binding RTX toxin-like protein